MQITLLFSTLTHVGLRDLKKVFKNSLFVPYFAINIFYSKGEASNATQIAIFYYVHRDLTQACTIKTFVFCDSRFVIKIRNESLGRSERSMENASIYSILSNNDKNMKKHRLIRTSLNKNVCFTRMIHSKFDTVKNTTYVMKIRLRYCD